MSSQPSAPVASSSSGYYGLPVLKKPVWTWEVPAYFFVGGIAGPSAIIAAVSERGALTRDAQLIAAGGGLASAALLIADLGRPERFLNMLRVFKPQSPMSVGSWILMLFSSTSAATAMAQAIVDRTRDDTLPVRLVEGATLGSSFLSAALGSVLATYTGVLIGSTAIPVWNTNARLLPVHFGAAGLGSAASLLELLGHEEAGLNRIALAAAAIETAVFAALEMDPDPALAPLKTGAASTGARLGSVLAGPVPLVLRLLAGRSRRWRRVAAVSSLAGSFLSRLAWIAAGRESADDPRGPLELT
jgi:formate-dependent nitrite reductase membrane component NrfD